jgi:hypothetical protein
MNKNCEPQIVTDGKSKATCTYWNVQPSGKSIAHEISVFFVPNKITGKLEIQLKTEHPEDLGWSGTARFTPTIRDQGELATSVAMSAAAAMEIANKTEDLWLEAMKKLHGELFTRQQMHDRYDIVGQANGVIIVKIPGTKTSAVLNFCTSPGGTRYYWEV